MSRQATAWASSRAPKSKGAARALLLILADMASERDGHSCYAKVETLAERAGVHQRTIQRQLTQLELVGDIVIDLGGGRGNTSRYTLHQVGAKGDTFDTFCEPEKVTVLTQKGDTSVVRSIYEPVLTDDEEDDLAAPLRSELARIVGRTLTSDERAVIDDNATTPAERRRMVKALSRLSARWSTIEARHNVAKWLQQTFGNIDDEHAATEQRRRKYVPDEPSAPLDELRLEHAIDPEPWTPPPPHGPVDVSDGKWDKVKRELELQLTPSAYNTWLRSTTAVAWDDERIVIATANPYARDWLDNRLKSVVARTVRSIHGHQGEIVMVVAA